MNKLRRKRMRLVTECIFCGRTDLSREHVWPTWSHQFIPKSPLGRHITKLIATSAKNPRISGERYSKERFGDVKTVKLKVVCKKHCNSGWMSRLETTAKPILIPLLIGSRIFLNKYEQEILATWIAMKMMICEFSNPDEIVTRPIERALLMGRRLPPDNMGIWIAHYHGPSWNNAYLRQACTLGWAEAGKAPTPLNNSLAKNTQSQTLGIGELVVQSITTYVPGLEFQTPTIFPGAVKPIWPYKQNFMWPPGPILSDAAVGILATALDRFTARLPWHPGPERTS